MIIIGWLPVQTPLRARPGLGNKFRYEAPGDLQVETDKNAVINIGLVGLFPRSSFIYISGGHKQFIYVEW